MSLETYLCSGLFLCGTVFFRIDRFAAYIFAFRFRFLRVVPAAVVVSQLDYVDHDDDAYSDHLHCCEISAEDQDVCNELPHRIQEVVRLQSRGLFVLQCFVPESLGADNRERETNDPTPVPD